MNKRCKRCGSCQECGNVPNPYAYWSVVPLYYQPTYPTYPHTTWGTGTSGATWTSASSNIA